MNTTKILSLAGLLLTISSANAFFDCTANKCGSPTADISKIVTLCFSENGNISKKMLDKNPNCTAAFLQHQCAKNSSVCTKINEIKNPTTTTISNNTSQNIQPQTSPNNFSQQSNNQTDPKQASSQQAASERADRFKQCADEALKEGRDPRECY